MLNQYERITFTLRSLMSLIETSGVQISVKFEDIERDIRDFQAGKFDNVKRFEDNVEVVLSEVEKIKVFCERIEHVELTKLTDFVRFLGYYKIFSLFTGEEVEEVKRALEDVVTHVNRNMNRLIRDHRRLLGKHYPTRSKVKRFLSFARLAKHEAANSRTLGFLETQEADLRSKIEEAMKRAKQAGKIDGTDREDLIVLLVKYFATLDNQFQELYEIMIDSEVQETDFILTLRDLERIDNEDLRKIFQKISDEYSHLINRDLKDIDRMKQTDVMTRRRFLKEAGLAAGAVGAALALPGQAEGQTSQDEALWNKYVVPEDPRGPISQDPAVGESYTRKEMHFNFRGECRMTGTVEGRAIDFVHSSIGEFSYAIFEIRDWINYTQRQSNDTVNYVSKGNIVLDLVLETPEGNARKQIELSFRGEQTNSSGIVISFAGDAAEYASTHMKTMVDTLSLNNIRRGEVSHIYIAPRNAFRAQFLPYDEGNVILMSQHYFLGSVSQVSYTLSHELGHLKYSQRLSDAQKADILNLYNIVRSQNLFEVFRDTLLYEPEISPLLQQRSELEQVPNEDELFTTSYSILISNRLNEFKELPSYTALTPEQKAVVDSVFVKVQEIMREIG